MKNTVPITEKAPVELSGGYALAFTYENMNEGDQIECEDFWHSNILSWKQGTVVFALGRKLFCPNEKYASSQFIFPHRMQNYRPCQKK